jgi:hypothetical protein
MAKGRSSRNNSDWNSNSDVSDDLTYDGLSSKVHKLEDALCNQDKLLCRVFCENKDLNLKLENSFSEIASLQSMHNDMSAKPCENCNMIMVNYADLLIVHTQVASQLKGVKLELKELKARSLLLGACTSCPMLKFDLEAYSIEFMELKQRLDHSSRYIVFSSPCEVCGTLKGKLLHATKENSELKQEVAYLSSCLKRTIVSEKMIEEDLSRVEESTTKFTYKLGVGFKRCEDKGEKSAPKFVPSSNYPKPSFNPKRGVKKNRPNRSDEVCISMFCGRTGHMDEFCFQRKRMEKRHVDDARNPYHDDFIDFLPHFSSRALSHFLMDLTIAHKVLVHERVVLCLDALVMTHSFIVVFVPHIGMVFPLEVSILTLS